MSFASTLAVALFAGLPEVVITDEHPPGGDPTVVKIAVTNRTEEIIGISFRPQRHNFWFQFHIFDERGRPATLERTKPPDVIGGPSGLVWIKPGKTVTGYLSPRVDYVVPPGRYRIAVVYRYQLLDRLVEQEWVPSEDAIVQEIESNQITKTFP